MIIERTFSAERLNTVLNDSAVFPWVSAPGIDRLDFTEVAADPANFVLMTAHGGFVFVPKPDGIYEVHTQFLPSGRRIAFRAAQDAARFMFTQTACEGIETYVPEGNDPAKRLTEAMRFARIGREGFWTYPDGRTVPVAWYLLTKDSWICQQQQS